MLFALHLAVVVLCMILGFVLFKGKGLFLIAGYNTASKEKKRQIDEKKLSRFVGKIMFVSAGCWLIIALSDVLSSMPLHFFGLGLFVAAALAAVIYANTGKRFQR